MSRLCPNFSQQYIDWYLIPVIYPSIRHSVPPSHENIPLGVTVRFRKKPFYLRYWPCIPYLLLTIKKPKIIHTQKLSTLWWFNSQGLILQNKHKNNIMTFDSTAKKQIAKLSTLSIHILQWYKVTYSDWSHLNIKHKNTTNRALFICCCNCYKSSYEYMFYLWRLSTVWFVKMFGCQ